MSASVGDGPPRQSWVLHVDLDQFIAAVEVLRRGAGRAPGGGRRPGRPDRAWRGGDGVMQAREFRVRSGMPLRIAARKCPDAVFLPADHTACDAASAEVMDTLRSLEWGGVPVVVEVLGWDEAFLAAGEGRAEDLGDPRDFAEHVRNRVLGRPACTPRSGSATPSCGPRSRPTSASRAGCGS